VEKDDAEMFERPGNYNKKRRSGGIHLSIQISPSDLAKVSDQRVQFIFSDLLGF
jgi:hypothetical protein